MAKPDDHEEEPTPAELKTYFDSEDFDLVDVLGDGACLFRAVSHQLNGTESGHPKLRLAVCDYMVQHRTKLLPFMAGFVAEKDTTTVFGEEAYDAYGMLGCFTFLNVN